MTDPEEQLRRVAEHRAVRVGAHEPDVAVSADEPRRRMWRLAAAAVVVLMAGIVGVVWTLAGDEENGTVDQPDVEIADPPSSTIAPPTTTPPTSTTLRPVDPACEREDSWAVGDLDGDGLEDRLSPPDRRVLDEEQGLEATDTMICLGTGAEHPWTFTGRWVAASMQDFDRDGRDEVLLYDNFQPWFTSTIHVYVDDEHIELLPLLDETGEPFELHYTFDGLNDAPGHHADSDRWFGCTDLVASDGEDLVTGTFTHDLEAEVVTWELAPISWSGTTVSVGSPIRGSFTLSAERALDADFVMPGMPARRFCKVEPSPCDLGAQLIGDVDGDGRDDVVAPEAARVCLANGVVADYDIAATNPEVWWLGDIEGGGRMELWLGGTTAFSVIASPWSISADGSVDPVETATECCQQYVPGTDLSDQTWFSCADGEVVTGGFEIGEESGLVRWWTDPVLTGTSLLYASMFDEPLTTAWIPGNGCQGTPWTGLIEWNDWVVDELSIAELNEWIASNQQYGAVAAFGQVRDALDVAESLRSASGPYRESAEEGWIEIHGLHDDSTGAIRYDIELSADGSRVEGIAQTWSCQPGRGRTDFTAEPCL